MSAVGTVTLVGAGPGTLDLLTVGGLRALEQADVIVADRLGARTVLDELAAERGTPLPATIIDVGKTPGHHAVTQDAIQDVLVAEARAGRAVVRLKGGDPFVFGRGVEEIAHCASMGIPVVVIPGVTSVTSVPALAGIPLTHRGVAAGFQVVSGHEPLTEFPGGRDHTVVILMGIGTLAASTAALARGERGSDCPVAMIEDGYGPSQRITFGTLATAPILAARHGVRSPAVVVVGDVVRLSPACPADLTLRTLEERTPIP